MDLDTHDNRDKAYEAALAYLTDTKYQFERRYPWNTFMDSLPSNVDKDATINNMYFVDGLDDIPDYFGVLITLKSGAKPAAVQVALPGFEPLRTDAVPVPANGDMTVSVMDITRLSSLPPGPLEIGFKIKDLPVHGSPPHGSIIKFTYDPREEDMPTPTLVWKPCRQSFSPFLPFYKFDTKNSFPGLPNQFVYLRADFQLDVPGEPVNTVGFMEFDTTSLGF